MARRRAPPEVSKRLTSQCSTNAAGTAARTRPYIVSSSAQSRFSPPCHHWLHWPASARSISLHPGISQGRPLPCSRRCQQSNACRCEGVGPCVIALMDRPHASRSRFGVLERIDAGLQRAAAASLAPTAVVAWCRGLQSQRACRTTRASCRSAVRQLESCPGGAGADNGLADAATWPPSRWHFEITATTAHRQLRQSRSAGVRCKLSRSRRRRTSSAHALESGEDGRVIRPRTRKGDRTAAVARKASTASGSSPYLLGFAEVLTMHTNTSKCAFPVSGAAAGFCYAQAVQPGTRWAKLPRSAPCCLQDPITDQCTPRSPSFGLACASALVLAKFVQTCGHRQRCGLHRLFLLTGSRRTLARVPADADAGNRQCLTPP